MKKITKPEIENKISLRSLQTTRNQQRWKPDVLDKFETLESSGKNFDTIRQPGLNPLRLDTV